MRRDSWKIKLGIRMWEVSETHEGRNRSTECGRHWRSMNGFLDGYIRYRTVFF